MFTYLGIRILGPPHTKCLDHRSKRLKVDISDSSKLVLRLRSTVQFKTSGGRVLVVKNQPASMTFGAFRKLFGIPSDAITLVAFKEKDAKGFEQWIVSAGDDMLVPLFDGRIVAETCTDF